MHELTCWNIGPGPLRYHSCSSEPAIQLPALGWVLLPPGKWIQWACYTEVGARGSPFHSGVKPTNLRDLFIPHFGSMQIHDPAVLALTCFTSLHFSFSWRGFMIIRYYIYIWQHIQWDEQHKTFEQPVSCFSVFEEDWLLVTLAGGAQLGPAGSFATMMAMEVGPKKSLGLRFLTSLDIMSRHAQHVPKAISYELQVCSNQLQVSLFKMLRSQLGRNQSWMLQNVGAS